MSLLVKIIVVRRRVDVLQLCGIGVVNGRISGSSVCVVISFFVVFNLVLCLSEAQRVGQIFQHPEEFSRICVHVCVAVHVHVAVIVVVVIIVVVVHDDVGHDVEDGVEQQQHECEVADCGESFVTRQGLTFNLELEAVEAVDEVSVEVAVEF